MGDWQHPEHYTDAAKHYAEAVRTAEIKLFVETVLPILRGAAYKVGYTLAVHGSQRRDLDLVAIPWTEEACDTKTFVETLCSAVHSCTGWGQNTDRGGLTVKPHGRRSTTIVANFNLELDVSIMPLLQKED